MTETYLLSYAAEQDIEEVINYLALENTQAAYDFIDALYDAFEMLATNPHLGHLRKDLADQTVRFWPFKWHYLVVYKPEKPLSIVRVISGLRDIANLIPVI